MAEGKKIALVEPFVSHAALKSYADKTEPMHLVGMCNLLRAAGMEVDIIDAYSRQLSAPKLLAELRQRGVTHLGITTYDYGPSVSYVAEIVEAFRDQGVTVLGGPGPTYTPERMAELIAPDWLISGDGEEAFATLARADFSPKETPHQPIGPSRLVRGGHVDLNLAPFTRPYSLAEYGYEASPRLQKGCVGKCIFCVGAYQAHFEYLKPQRAVEVINHLVKDCGAQTISPAGPDFTTVPQAANDILAALLDSDTDMSAFRPGVRLDTLYAALMLRPELWRELSNRTRLSFESSIESFSPDRLQRLGKNVKPAFLDQLMGHLEMIFATCRATMVLGRIALDPTLTVEEFILDCQGFEQLLQQFPAQVTIGGMVMNSFVPLWGTPSMAAGEVENPWAAADDLRDPRMRSVRDGLLEHPRYVQWCQLAEQLPNYRERNEVFREILRVAREYAEQQLASSDVSLGN
jgi:hypothetical protein